jgi:hypothetical protein
MTTNLISERVYPNSAQILVHTLDQFIKTIAPEAEFVIAGGAVLSSYTFNKLDTSDIDIFPKTNVDLETIQIALSNLEIAHSKHPNCLMFDIPYDRRPIKDMPIPFTKAMMTEANSIHKINGEMKLRRHVPGQLIKGLAYDDIEGLIKTFDLTVCQIAYSNGRYLMTPEAYNDIAAKQLVLSDTFDINKFKSRRIIKYMKRGYELSGYTFKTIYLNNPGLYAGDLTITESIDDYDF